MRLRTSPLAARPFGQALLAALGTIQRQDNCGAPVPLRFVPAIELAAAHQPGLVAPAAAFSPASLRGRELLFSRRLQALLDETLGRHAIALDEGAPTGSSPLTFALRYRVQPSEVVYRTRSGLPRSYAGLTFDFELTLVDAAGRELYRLRQAIRRSVTDDTKLPAVTENDLLPYYALTDAAFDELYAALRRELGL